jgi:site-specific DNA-methyltransferase (adenine-specific)
MRREVIGGVELTCEDCMDLMKRYPDKYFDLAVVDPPYGIGQNWRKDPNSSFYRHNKSYKNEKIGAPYFSELFRVSDFQIIWGANYYTNYLEERNSWIVWDKTTSNNHRLFNSDCELAWTSFNKNMKLAKFVWDGFVTCEPRYGNHPHEKPVALYKWLLSKYAKPGWKILDTHLGSGSHAIACLDLGFPLVACEIDGGYFNAAVERIRLLASQSVFDFEGDKEIEANIAAPTLFELAAGE